MSTHRRSDTHGLGGRAIEHNFKAITDLKISAARTGRIAELHSGALGGYINGSDRQNE
jgi:hypothetical protein